jgi:hypothetical protein
MADAWVVECRKENVVPILATVVPITEKMPLMIRMKRFVKKYILLKDISPYHRDVRLQGILDYNDWVRNYSRENGLMVLDLEAVLRISDENRWLDPDLKTDGLHLNEKGYRRLDPLLPATVNKAAKYSMNGGA